MQPVFRFLLRLVAAAAVVVVVLLLLLLFKFVFKFASLSTSFRVSVSNQNFTDNFLVKLYFFPGHYNTHLQQSALFRLLCMTVTVLRT
jgi:hypothetical protein